MTKAENHELLLQGANNGTEFARALRTAQNEAVAEETNAAGALEVLEYADGSRLLVNVEARTAEVEA